MTFSMEQFTEQLFSKLLFSELSIDPAAHFYVAYSGGMDSTVLLHLMKEVQQRTDIKLTALHVNHNLQAGSGAWVDHCQSTCQAWQVDFKDTALQLPDASEKTARDARYQWFSEQIESNSVLLTAHHRQDRAETLLFNLMRGAGSSGLSSLRSVRSFYGSKLVRPLLSLSVDDIHDYALAHKLKWVNDPSNKSQKYARNQIRHLIVPELEKFRHDAVQNIARAADNLEQENDLLREIARADLKTIKQTPFNPLDSSRGVLLSDLQLLSKQRLANLLREWLRMAGFSLPSRNFLLQIVDAINSSPASTAVLQESGMQIRFFSGVLYAMPALNLLEPEGRVAWADPNQDILLLNGEVRAESTSKLRKLIAKEQISELAVVARDQLTSPKALGGHSLSVKKWLQASGVPTWRRSTVSVLCWVRDECDVAITVVDPSVDNEFLKISVLNS